MRTSSSIFQREEKLVKIHNGTHSSNSSNCQGISLCAIGTICEALIGCQKLSGTNVWHALCTAARLTGHAHKWCRQTERQMDGWMDVQANDLTIVTCRAICLCRWHWFRLKNFDFDVQRVQLINATTERERRKGAEGGKLLLKVKQLLESWQRLLQS